MPYFDLHSDTLFEAYHRNVSPYTGQALTAPIAVCPFGQTRRVLAIWSDNALDDDSAYDAFFDILAFYHSHTDEAKNALCQALLAVEDARLLANDLSRLDRLYAEGVRILTLAWSGVSSFAGAWNTHAPLSDFGKEAVLKAASLGMTVDLSHASDECFWEVMGLAKAHRFRPIASHSNSRSLCPHGRNLSDEMFSALVEIKGLCGVSFVPMHLAEDGNADIDTVIGHILHFLALGGEDILAIGSDFDGVSRLPEGIDGIRSIPSFAHRLEKATSKRITEKILYQNACRYFDTERS